MSLKTKHLEHKTWFLSNKKIRFKRIFIRKLWIKKPEWREFIAYGGFNVQ